MKNSALALTFCFSLATLCGCQPQKLYKETRVMMGSFVDVICPDKRAAIIAFEEIKRIEGLLSKYDVNSEISRLNKTGKLAVSQDTYYIMQKAKEFWQASDGAFDVTVGPLMDIWGFTDKRYTVPKKQEIAKTLKRIGMDKIIFHKKNNVIEFGITGMAVDLGGIAVGYAVDSAIAKIKAAGIKNCLINAGGDIYCLGNRAGKPWKVAVKNPRAQDFLGALSLEDSAVSTSGDYEKYFKAQGKIYSHILNPKTGAPAQSGVVSVTVIAPDCITADALATTIFTLGKESGIKLLEKYPGAKAEIVETKDASRLITVP